MSRLAKSQGSVTAASHGLRATRFSPSGSSLERKRKKKGGKKERAKFTAAECSNTDLRGKLNHKIYCGRVF